MTPADWILSQPWAMLPEHVAQMIAVADRDEQVKAAYQAVIARTGRPLDNTRKVEVRDGVAVVPVRGVLSRYADWFTEVCGGTSVETLAKDFRTALDSPAVLSIVLEIDSPGGQAAGIGELASMIRDGARSKPVVCYVSHLGASAGYWLASAGPEVVAAPSALLGSVGVVFPVAKNNGASRTIEFVSSQSPHKRPDPETESGRDVIQKNVDALASVFIQAVADFRGTKPEAVISDFGGGGLLVGQAAVDAGMADRLGSLEQIIHELSNGGRAGHSVSFSGHGAAAVAGAKGSIMPKINVGSLLTKWFAAGRPEVMEAAEVAAGEAVQAAEPAINSFVLSHAPALMPMMSETEAELRAKLKEAEATIAANAKAAEDSLAASAESWFFEKVKANLVLPADKPAMLAAFLDAAKADTSSPLAALASVGGRLGMFKASVDARTPHTFTSEQVPTDPDSVPPALLKAGQRVLDNQAGTPEQAQAKAAEARKTAMLAGAGVEIDDAK